MNIKINKQRKLSKYYCNTEHGGVCVNVPIDRLYRTIITPADLQEVYSADYIFASIVPSTCLSKKSMYISITSSTPSHNDYKVWGHYPENVIWKFKLIKPIHIYNYTFKYLYILF